LKRVILGLIVFISPSFLGVYFLRLFGNEVGKNVKIGFSFLGTTNVKIGNNVCIGHGNLILNKRIVLEDQANIGYFNILKGPFTLLLHKSGAIGNRNYLTRGVKGITYGESILELGELTKITTGHHLDLTRSIFFGDFSILAGIRSQLWTHGYYHSELGRDRIRIDGEIVVGDNVYIGSGCIFNPGVEISNAIHIGGGSVISKSLEKQGMYVNQGLRFIENDFEKIKGKLKEVKGFELIEQVYTKE